MVLWALLAALSVTISYLITFLLGAVGLLFGLLLLLVMLKAGLSFLGVILAVFTLVMGGTVLWSLLPGKIPFETNGVRIDLSRETRLRAEVEAMAKTLNEKIPDEVYLVPIANAAVLERGKKRIMLIGLPVLDLLTVSQFRAILAHEFAHYYSGDTQLGPWVFRARMNMAQVLTRLGRNSAVLSLLSNLAVVAILRSVILGGLSLWWKLFNRITQHVSRQQEYRCDELACYLAGSESLEKGLCSVNRAAATFTLYWSQTVVPVIAIGYRPPLSEGYRLFLQSPEIAKAALSVLEQQLAANATGPMDSHPPLNARVEKARSLAIASASEDNRPAVTLLEDLASLEIQLLTHVMPAVKASELKPMQWNTAGSEVYVPLWRGEVAKIAPHLSSITIYTLPNAIAKLTQIAGSIADPPGTLLTREQRIDRAADVIGKALTLALIDHGWTLHFQPGQFYMESETGNKINPGVTIQELRTGDRKMNSWLPYCEENLIGDWILASQAATGAS